MRPDVLTSPMCLFIICMMAGRRAGPGFFSGLGKGFLFVSNLPTMSPFSREMVRGEARAPHLVLHGIHAVVFLMRCSLFFFCWCSFIVLRCFLFFSAEYPCLILGFGVKMGLLRFCFVDFVSSWFMPTEREAGRGGEGNKEGWECVFSGVQTHDAWMGSMLI